MLFVGRLLLMSAILAMALIAGFFYAFGSSVLPGFEVLSPADAVRAMQAINAQVRNLMFAPSFFGALALTVAALVVYAGRKQWTVCLWVCLALAIYGGGAFWVTLSVNVPLNEGLARVDPASPDIARVADAYFAAWGRWNCFRTLASTIAVAALAMAWREDREDSRG